MIKYICRYTPCELFQGFGEECQQLNPVTTQLDLADQLIHPNVCSFCRTLLQEQLQSEDTLILTDCCDSVRRSYDVLRNQGKDVYLLGLPHKQDECSLLLYRDEMLKFIEEYSTNTGKSFDIEKFRAAFNPAQREAHSAYISVQGARISPKLYKIISEISPLPVKNASCTGPRELATPPVEENLPELLTWYSRELLEQTACMRMTDISSRRQLTEDPALKGIIYHTVKFCDFYEFESAKLQKESEIPQVNIETDWVEQENNGQLITRLEAFFETLNKDRKDLNTRTNSTRSKIPSYYAGIDIGSTTTNVVILDQQKKIVASAIVPTGSRTVKSSNLALSQALKAANLSREQLSNTVSTGYGRTNITFRDKDVTEITCHAKGAHYLNPAVRTVIDIGGQDSKIIRLDSTGGVKDFAMNDKCAAGTGRFLEMMARSLQLDLLEMSQLGLTYDEDITISSMCSVFAESEVISLIAANKKIDDIIHGINKSVASRVLALLKRVGSEEEYMVTGGVSKNTGLVNTIERQLGAKLYVYAESEICGALGAALIAAGD